jgi:hypothetical protein
MVTSQEEGQYGEDISLFWRQNTILKRVAKLGANGHKTEVPTWINFPQINCLLHFCGNINKRSHK